MNLLGDEGVVPDVRDPTQPNSIHQIFVDAID